MDVARWVNVWHIIEDGRWRVWCARRSFAVVLPFASWLITFVWSIPVGAQILLRESEPKTNEWVQSVEKFLGPIRESSAIATKKRVFRKSLWFEHLNPFSKFRAGPLLSMEQIILPKKPTTSDKFCGFGLTGFDNLSRVAWLIERKWVLRTVPFDTVLPDTSSHYY